MLVWYAVAFKNNTYLLKQVEHNPYKCHEWENWLPCSECAMKLLEDDAEV